MRVGNLVDAILLKAMDLVDLKKRRPATLLKLMTWWTWWTGILLWMARLLLYVVYCRCGHRNRYLTLQGIGEWPCEECGRPVIETEWWRSPRPPCRKADIAGKC